MIVRLKETGSEIADLTPSQPYVVIGIESDDYRLLNDEGRPYLYPAEHFDVLDAREPEDWVEERGEDSERYAYPPDLAPVGFFEDFFDAQKEAVATFWRVVNRRLAAA